MARILFILLALCLFKNSYAQNMVYNPGFELYDQCPDYLDQTNRCSGWINPTQASSDYYNSCDTQHLAGVPYNLAGYQQAAGGSAYGGLMTFDGYDLNYREYLKGRLTPLLLGHTYRVSMQVSRGDTVGFGSDGLAIFFTQDSTYIDPITTQYIGYTPQVDYSNYGIIMDSTNWVTLTDTFVADSAYRHFIIGCFKPDQSVMLDTVFTSWPQAYYYIDNVVVEEITSEGIDHITTTQQISIFPSPFTTSVDIIFSNPMHSPYNFSLFNIQGQRVAFIEDIRIGNFTLNRDALPSGIYYYKLVAENGQETYVGKLIAE